MYAEGEKEWKEDRKRDKGLRDGRLREGQKMCRKREREREKERAAHCVTCGQMVATLHCRWGTCDSREPWKSLPHPRLYCWHLSTYSGKERGGQGGGRGRFLHCVLDDWGLHSIFCETGTSGSCSRSKKTTLAFVKSQSGTPCQSICLGGGWHIFVISLFI